MKVSRCVFIIGIGVITISLANQSVDAQPAEPLPAAEPVTPSQAAIPPQETTPDVPSASADNLVSGFLALGYAYSDAGFGLGARYQKIVAPVGVIKKGPIHDEIGLEGGFDYYHYNFNLGLGNSISYNEFAVTFGATWNFWMLNEKLALYPKIDVSYRIGSFSSGLTSSGYGGIWIQGTGGVIYRTSGVSLRAELGSGSLRLGVGFSFF